MLQAQASPRSAGQLVRQESAHLTRLDAARDKTFADAAGEDEGEGAVLDLLVLGHGVEKGLGVAAAAGHVAQGGRQADAPQVSRNPPSILPRAQPEADG